MIRLRPYKPSDAWPLLEWWKDSDERSFVMWSAGKFEYPLTIEQLDGYFSEWCLREDSGWLMTALDGSGKPVGHFILRMADYEAGTVRLGFIVLDPKERGTGMGKELISQALKYAFEVLGMERATLVVFEENASAKACYEAAGFVGKEYIPQYIEYKGASYAGRLMEAARQE